MINIVGESSVGASNRRVESLVGMDAFRRFAAERALVSELSSNLKTRPEQLRRPDRASSSPTSRRPRSASRSSRRRRSATASPRWRRTPCARATCCSWPRPSARSARATSCARSRPPCARSSATRHPSWPSRRDVRRQAPRDRRDLAGRARRGSERGRAREDDGRRSSAAGAAASPTSRRAAAATCPRSPRPSTRCAGSSPGRPHAPGSEARHRRRTRPHRRRALRRRRAARRAGRDRAASGRRRRRRAPHPASSPTEYDAIELVVGNPLSLSGAATAVDRGRDRVRGAPGGGQRGPVRLVDERLSTVSAQQALRASGKSSRNQRPIVDQVAAVIILQHAIDTERASGDRARTPAHDRRRVVPPVTHLPPESRGSAADRDAVDWHALLAGDHAPTANGSQSRPRTRPTTAFEPRVGWFDRPADDGRREAQRGRAASRRPSWTARGTSPRAKPLAGRPSRRGIRVRPARPREAEASRTMGLPHRPRRGRRARRRRRSSSCRARSTRSSSGSRPPPTTRARAPARSCS